MSLFTDKQFIFIGAVAVGVGALVYYKGKETLNKVDPTNQENIFNETFNNVFYPDGNSSLGSDIYDLLNPSFPPEEDVNENGIGDNRENVGWLPNWFD